MADNGIEVGSRFLASTLHEVRTPIQTILSTTELLGDTDLDAEQTEYVHQIEFAANILLQLANDVLDYTKIRSKEFALESIPFDIIELTEHVVDMVSIEAFNKGLEVITNIDYAIPKMVMGDPDRVQQILLNLVKNAVKFTHSGYILIRLTLKSKDLYFEVIDSGIGVPLEKQTLIFNEFYQVDASTTRRFGGTGLGLAICKNLVSLMDGRIGVRDNTPSGSIFWFTLPLGHANVGTEEKFELEAPAGTHVLMVDDNELALRSMADKMTDFGIHSIETATSGEEALSKLSAAADSGFPFTTVFIDMIMPGMDGWRLAAEINKNPHINSVKTYLMVPEGQMGKDAKMKTLDWFNGYLYKPIKRNPLLNTLIGSFSHTLELTPEEQEVEEKSATPRPIIFSETLPAEGSTILIAEDHPVNRKIIETFLKKFGATVYVAANGEEAVAQIAAHPEIEMIFMDILMPVKSGLDATIELRNSGYKGIIIACTANNDPDDFNEYLRQGINDILVKPFKRDAIKQLLEKWSTVLSFPEAQDIISMADLSNKTTGIWDINDFMDTVDGNTELASSLMDDFLTHTQQHLDSIKAEFDAPERNFEKLGALAHTIKGSSGAVSAIKLAEEGSRMNEAAKHNDSIAFETARTDFAIDFLELKNIVAKWKSSL